MNSYPLKLVPVTKNILWGGNYLNKNFSIGNDHETIAEAWMMTVRADGVNAIENGESKGLTLEEYIKENGMEKVCGNYTHFPLLIKLIDANDRLSVQVHPDDEYASQNGLDAGKTEMWYVVDAKPGAKLVYGLKTPQVPSFQEICEKNNNGTLDDILNYVEVKKGDCFFIPAGLVHAIGNGIVIAEIQQNSNTTFRLYDYDRTDKNGNKRELHIEKAAQVIKTQFYNKSDVNVVERKTNCETITTLCDCDMFTAVKYDITKGASSFFNGGKMKNILCIAGSGYISYNNEKYELIKGASYLIPADMDSFNICTENNDIEIIVSYAK